MAHKALCINRLAGSGGHVVGEMVAKKLGIGYYDSNLLQMAVEYGGLLESSQLQKYLDADEKMPNKAFFKLLDEGNENVPKGSSASDSIYEIQQKLIRELANREDCVIVGRCAGETLSAMENVDVLKVFIMAPHDFRVDTIMAKYDWTKREAEHEIKKLDRRRKDYFYNYTRKDWLDNEIYDVIVNTGSLGFERSAELLAGFFTMDPTIL